MINKKWFFVLLPVVAVACAQTSLRQGHGDSVAHNQQAQVINPEPVNPEKPAGFDGQKAENVMNSYRNEKGATESGKLITEIGDD